MRASASTTVGGVALLRATGDSHAGDGADAAQAWVDITPPVTTIALTPATPGVTGWYAVGVTPSASAADPSPGTGVAGTRCVLDPSSEPASFDDLPAGPCPYLAPGQYVLSDGIHTLWAGSKDGAGNTDLVSSTFQIDRTPPLAQVGPLAMFQGAATFPVSWSGSDSASGVKNYDIRYRQAASNGTFGSYTTWLTHTTSTSAAFTAPAGTTTCFSARDTDNATWTGIWSAEQCTTVPLDDPALTRTGSWSTVNGSGYYGPSVSRSTTYNNKLSVTMRGQTIGVLVTKAGRRDDRDPLERLDQDDHQPLCRLGAEAAAAHFHERERPDRHARDHRPRLRQRRHRRRRRLQDVLSRGGRSLRPVAAAGRP